MRFTRSTAPALLALAAGASTALADFTFFPQCNTNWYGECTTTPCPSGGYNTFNNWGFTACAGGLPLPGAGAVVHIGSNQVVANGGVGIGSLDMTAGATLYIRSDFGVTSPLTNIAAIVVDGGNISLSGTYINAGMWVEPSGYNRNLTTFSLTNNSGATINLQSGTWSPGAGGAVISNNGTITKTTGGGFTSNTPLVNTGLVQVSEGGLYVASTTVTSSAAAAYNTSSTATLLFNNDTMGGTFNGDTSGYAAWVSNWAQSANVTLNFTGNGFAFAGGYMNTAPYSLTNTGIVNWTTGNSSYTGTLNNSGTITDIPGYSRAFQDFTINNSGTIDLQTTAWYPNGAAAFNNTGLLRKSTGGGATLSIPVTNSGPVQVEAGALLFTGSTMSSTNAATYSTAATGSLRFNNMTLSGTFNGFSNGLIRVEAGLALGNNLSVNISGNGWEWSGSSMDTAGYTLTNQAVWTWNTGNAAIAGTFINNGTLRDTPGYNRQFNGAVLTNNNTVNWLTNTWSPGSGTNLFTNNGTISKTTGGGTSISVPVVNNGSLAVQEGPVYFSGTFQSGAAAGYTTAATAQLYFDSVPMSGTFNGVMDGYAALRGNSTFTANTSINFSHNGINWAGGLLDTGAFTLTNAGLMTWSTGNATVSGTLTNTGTLVDVPGYNRAFQNFTLNNPGTVEAQTTTWSQPGGASSLFSNTGTFRKTTDGGATMNVPFTTSGQVLVEAGQLLVNSSMTSTAGAAHTVSSGAFYNFSNATLSGIFNVANAGLTRISGGLTLAGNTTFNVTGNGIEWNGSTFNASSFTATNAGLMVWNAGNAELIGAMVNTGTIIDVPGYNRNFNNFTLTNNGQVEWQTTTWSNPGGGSFSNSVAGTARKTTGGGATMNLPVANAGTIDIQSGPISFNGGLTQSAGVTRLNGGSINNGTLIFNGGRFEGNGTAVASVSNPGGVVAPGLSAGDMTIQGNYTQGAAGAYEVELAGPSVGQFDHLRVTGGASLSGVLIVKFIGSYNPLLGTSFRILDVNGTRTGTFSSIQYVNQPYSTAAQVSYDAHGATLVINQRCGEADFDGDGDSGTDFDIEAFFACLAGNCCPTCLTADFDYDGDTGTDADIEAFFRVLGGAGC